MSERPVSVLICDDSALMRNLIGRIIEGAPGLSVAGKAMNGRFALEKIGRLDPDVMILDLEMPEMNGIEFLRERKARGIQVPVVILSSVAKRGAKITMEALSLGASDFILKPSGSISEDINTISRLIVDTVRAYGQKYQQRRGETDRGEPRLRDRTDAPSARSPEAPHRPISGTRPGSGAAGISKPEVPAPPRPTTKPSGKTEILAIGISTGGPNALRQLFGAIDGDIGVPIVVVQHMPAGFTAEFAKSLDRICPLEVREAAEGDLVTPNRVLIAPGDLHMRVEKRRLATVVRLSHDETVNGHRPSVDVLFSSVAKAYGDRALAVIMTGMGRDGAKEIGTIFNSGGITVAQDSASCIVYGMPKVAAENGYIRHVFSLSEMAGGLSKLVKESA